LGTINSVRLSVDALAVVALPVIVVLNRFEPDNELHERNLDWLLGRDELAVVTMHGEEERLADLIRG